MSTASPVVASPSTIVRRVNAKERTLYCESWRAVCSGIIETGASTFLLLIALQYYNTGATAKALIAAGSSVGFLVAPLIVHWVACTRWRTSCAGGVVLGIGSLGFLVPGLAGVGVLPWLNCDIVFVAGSLLALIMLSGAVPLFTQIYQDNYPAEHRGALFSTTIVIRIATAAMFGYVAGSWLDGHLERFGWLLLVFAGAMMLSAFCLSRCPSRALARPNAGPLHALHWIRDDKVFRNTLLSWMLMGFGNLMMITLRVEYLGNPAYGIALTAGAIAWLNVIIPNLSRLAVSSTWGRVFDRMNFFWLRIALNLGFAVGILTFFTGDSIAGLITGAIIFGISIAGGDVTWSLYVTKLAPEDRVAEYMCVHTFLTGIRGVIAPQVAFHLLATLHLGIGTLALISASFILLACALIVPEALAARTRSAVSSQ